MVDETTLAKIDAFIEELKVEGIEDVVFACASPEGFMVMEVAANGRENNGE
jgi:hypothetical protein